MLSINLYRRQFAGATNGGAKQPIFKEPRWFLQQQIRDQIAQEF